eukprot:TRINITY_DN12380_c0_g1_i1.p1 TRINITY_DN12380_c0_g1~~TRINITY_DN12380_c0_g1_i1.p1  ORF type:complete len:1486 (-),score=309.60 TRINITY_DN12380_c0_g1_i1:8-4465(-)
MSRKGSGDSLKGKNFFLDLRSGSEKVAEKLLKLGAIVDPFFHPNQIDFVITDGPLTPAPLPQSPAATPSAPSRPNLGRAALLQQQAARDADSGSLTDIVAVARKNNISVKQLNPKLIAWLDHQISKQQKTVSNPIAAFLKEPDSARRPRGREIQLKGLYIVVEDTTEISRPMYKVFPEDSTIHLQWNPPRQEEAPRRKRKHKTGRRRHEDGYCECCNVKYDEYSDHFNGDIHAEFVAKEHAWDKFDAFANRLREEQRIEALLATAPQGPSDLLQQCEQHRRWLKGELSAVAEDAVDEETNHAIVERRDSVRTDFDTTTGDLDGLSSEGGERRSSGRDFIREQMMRSAARSATGDVVTPAPFSVSALSHISQGSSLAAATPFTPHSRLTSPPPISPAAESLTMPSLPAAAVASRKAPVPSAPIATAPINFESAMAILTQVPSSQVESPVRPKVAALRASALASAHVVTPTEDTELHLQLVDDASRDSFVAATPNATQSVLPSSLVLDDEPYLLTPRRSGRKASLAAADANKVTASPAKKGRKPATDTTAIATVVNSVVVAQFADLDAEDSNDVPILTPRRRSRYRAIAASTASASATVSESAESKAPSDNTGAAPGSVKTPTKSPKVVPPPKRVSRMTNLGERLALTAQTDVTRLHDKRLPAEELPSVAATKPTETDSPVRTMRKPIHHAAAAAANAQPTDSAPRVRTPRRVAIATVPVVEPIGRASRKFVAGSSNDLESRTALRSPRKSAARISLPFLAEPNSSPRKVAAVPAVESDAPAVKTPRKQAPVTGRAAVTGEVATRTPRRRAAETAAPEVACTEEDLSARTPRSAKVSKRARVSASPITPERSLQLTATPVSTPAPAKASIESKSDVVDVDKDFLIAQLLQQEFSGLRPRNRVSALVSAPATPKRTPQKQAPTTSTAAVAASPVAAVTTPVSIPLVSDVVQVVAVLPSPLTPSRKSRKRTTALVTAAPLPAESGSAVATPEPLSPARPSRKRAAIPLQTAAAATAEEDVVVVGAGLLPTPLTPSRPSRKRTAALVAAETSARRSDAAVSPGVSLLTPSRPARKRAAEPEQRTDAVADEDFAAQRVTPRRRKPEMVDVTPQKRIRTEPVQLSPAAPMSTRKHARETTAASPVTKVPIATPSKKRKIATPTKPASATPLSSSAASKRKHGESDQKPELSAVEDDDFRATPQFRRKFVRGTAGASPGQAVSAPSTPVAVTTTTPAHSSRKKAVTPSKSATKVAASVKSSPAGRSPAQTTKQRTVGSPTEVPSRQTRRVFGSNPAADVAALRRSGEKRDFQLPMGVRLGVAVANLGALHQEADFKLPTELNGALDDKMTGTHYRKSPRRRLMSAIDVETSDEQPMPISVVNKPETGNKRTYATPGRSATPLSKSAQKAIPQPSPSPVRIQSALPPLEGGPVFQRQSALTVTDSPSRWTTARHARRTIPSELQQRLLARQADGSSALADLIRSDLPRSAKKAK